MRISLFFSRSFSAFDLLPSIPHVLHTRCFLARITRGEGSKKKEKQSYELPSRLVVASTCLAKEEERGVELEKLAYSNESEELMADLSYC